MPSNDANRIGIDVDDLRLGPRRGLEQAAAMAFRAVELGAAAGEVSPRELGSSARRELRRYAQGLGLELVSLSADMPRLRLTDPATVEERIERTCQILDLARDLQVPTVTAGVGSLSDPKSGGLSELVVESLGRMGEYAEARGVRLALRPSYEAGDRWIALLDRLRCRSLCVGLDPASMVMAGANPLASIERFIEQVALFHARDATAGFADPHGGEPRFGHETALGEGDVDLVGVLNILREVDYRGPYILRRHDARDPRSELASSRDVLLRML